MKTPGKILLFDATRQQVKEVPCHVTGEDVTGKFYRVIVSELFISDRFLLRPGQSILVPKKDVKTNNGK